MTIRVGITKVTENQWKRGYIVVVRALRRVLTEAGHEPGTSEGEERLITLVGLDTGEPMICSYYQSLRQGSGRPPELRLGREIKRYLQVERLIALVTDGEMVGVMKNGPRRARRSFEQLAVRTFRRHLRERYAAPSRLPALPVPPETTSGGQGFRGSAEERRAIEFHAMAEARRHLESLGWRNVSDRSGGAPYDLFAEREGDELYVEVKGTTGAGNQVLVTRGEVEFARRNAGRCLLFVLSGVLVDSREGVATASGGRIRVVQPWAPTDGSLDPVSFMFTLPEEE